jgi:tRNA nucleotidyltransferase/poly(A) polymerase
VNLYLVGGAVRRHMRGLPAKDFDFAVEATSYDAMKKELRERGVKLYGETPHFVTIRGSLPKTGFDTFGGLLPPDRPREIPADFTLCRKETMYSDGRHPDAVMAGSLEDDLARRDFTVNAVAYSEYGAVYDYHEGMKHSYKNVLYTVGLARDRFEEDPLRIMRALRFMVTEAFQPSMDLDWALSLPSIVDRLANTTGTDRVREELNKMLRVDWVTTMELLFQKYPRIGRTLGPVNYPKLWLKATTEKK